MRTNLLALALPLALTACLPDETGIDHTVLTGTLTIPPATAEDTRGNNDLAAASPLGADDSTSLTYRSVVVAGKVSSWEPQGIGALYGDPDYYVFTPIADGTFTVTLTFATAPGSGIDADTADTAGATADADVFQVELIDPATYDAATGAGVLSSASTDGTGGVYSFTYDVAAGTDYALLVAGASTDDVEELLAYTLVVSGSTPDDSTILVGAYLGSDPQVAESPVGGTNATTWTYDATTYTWSGAYRMMWLRAVTPAPEDTDTGDLFEPASTVEEGPATVYLRAGTLSALNAAPAAGALYTTVSVEAGSTNAETPVDAPLVLDGVFPKVIGIQATETLPDTTLAEIVDADNTVVLETLVAQDLGMLSGLGYVDVISGSVVLDPAFEGWNGTNDSDAYAFTVPEAMSVRMTTSWPDATADVDIGIWGDVADWGRVDLFWYYGDDNCLSGDNPEVCELVVTLEPETTYYVVVLGYLGTDEQPYTVEMEWVAP
jgi:hypothetical protein